MPSEREGNDERSVDIKQTSDIVSKIMSFAHFHDIIAASQVCQIWRKACASSALISRLLQERWVYSPLDYGSGSGVCFAIKDSGDSTSNRGEDTIADHAVIQSYWKLFLVAKERIQVECALYFDPNKDHFDCTPVYEKTQTMVTRLLSYAQRWKYGEGQTIRHFAYNVESHRWLIQLFDHYMLHQQSSTEGVSESSMYVPPKRVFPQIPVSPEFVEALFSILIDNLHNPEIVQICARSVGVLAINERNRRIIGTAQRFAKLMKVIECHSHFETIDGTDAQFFGTHSYTHQERSIVGNVLWACVILCRPLGAQEGEAYSRTDMSNYKNISEMHRAGCLTTILFVIETFHDHPMVLAKAFWLIVNLSLIDTIKRHLIHSRIIKKICGAMISYPDHRELQYRACFALINITLRSHARQQLLSKNGISLIFKAMNRFPEDYLLQRCCINVIRSLLSGVGRIDAAVLDQLLQNDVAEVLANIVSKFSETQSDLSTLAARTLHYL